MRVICLIGCAVLLLAACTGTLHDMPSGSVPPTGPAELAQPGSAVDQAGGEKSPPGAGRQLFLAEEVQALKAQPYIDPLTRFLEQHRGDAARENYLAELEILRDERCKAIAERYARQPRTAATFARFRAGYAFSCPEQLAEFADLVERVKPAEEPLQTPPAVNISAAPPIPDLQRSECYLLTQIRNYSEAHDFCLSPAEDGDPRAQLNMALISQAAKEYAQAFRWAEMVAADMPEAGLVLGQLFADGHGVERDLGQAAIWFERAAEQGLAAAQTAIGQLTLRGEGTAVDPQSARQWFLKAARQNDGRALYSLGEMSETGLVVEQDLVEALVWYDLASLNGMRDARVKVEMLSQEVTGEQFSRAEQRVRQLLAGEL